MNNQPPRAVSRHRPKNLGDALSAYDDGPRIAAASRALHLATMRLGARSGGCWNLSAAQCRARLKEGVSA